MPGPSLGRASDLLSWVSVGSVYLLALAFSGLFWAGSPAKTGAPTPSVDIATFEKCEPLLTKSPGEVASILGPPQQAPTSNDPPPRGTVEWAYRDQDKFHNERELSLKFMGGRLLAATLSWTNQVSLKEDLEASTLAIQAKLAELLASADHSSMRMLIPRSAEVAGADHETGDPFMCTISAATAGGHPMDIECLIDSGAGHGPLLSHKTLNVTTGLYETAYERNPNFVVSGLKLVISIEMFVTDAERRNVNRMAPGMRMPNTGDDSRWRPRDTILSKDTDVIPITESNSPWIWRGHGDSSS